MCLGIPGRLVEIIDEEQHRGMADIDGVRREINIGLVLGEAGGIKVGDWVLIHVGFAMSKISEEGAAEQNRLLAMLGEDAAAMEEIEGYDFGQRPERWAS
jgi:hydrogenase expression/formation protein HypC